MRPETKTPIGQWFACCFKPAPGQRTYISTLFKSWCKWSSDLDLPAGTRKELNDWLRENGLYIYEDYEEHRQFCPGCAQQDIPLTVDQIQEPPEPPLPNPYDVDTSMELGWWFSQNLTPSESGVIELDILHSRLKSWYRALKLNAGSKHDFKMWLLFSKVNTPKTYITGYVWTFPQPSPSRCPI